MNQENSPLDCLELLDQVPVGTCVIDQQLRVRFWNYCLEEWTRLPREKILGEELFLHFPHLKDAKYANRIQDVLRGGPPTILSSQIHKNIFPAPLPGGGMRIQHTTIVSVPSSDGQDLQAMFVVEDVTSLTHQVHDYRSLRDSALEEVKERRRIELELRRIQARNEGLIASLSSFLIGVDENGKIAQWNPAAENTFGIRAGAVLGEAFLGCPIPWDWKRIRSRITAVGKDGGEIHLNDLSFTRRDGKKGLLSVTLSPVILESGERAGYLLLGNDVTERRMLESQFEQAKKMEAIGRLAAGIAHEINTPIQYVGDNTNFMLDQFSGILNLLDKYHQLLQSAHSMPELAPLCGEIQSDAQRIDLDYLTEEIPQALNETLEGVERVARIVSAMKEFSHPGLGGKAPANLNRLVESTVTVARNEWKYVAEVELDLDCGLPAVPCTAGSINQVLLNLVINAAHAISQVADRESQEKRKIYISTHARGPWAEIRVTDEGPGIAPEIRDRIFDPFFTTKEPGKGTGQGLSIAHTVICDRHGGELTFETERGKGTTFIVRLPVNPPDWPPEIQ